MKNNNSQKTKMMVSPNRERWATLFLMIALFLNPMGFDVVQLTLIELTGSLLGANLVLYCLALFFFGLYFYFSRNSPFVVIKDIVLNLYFGRLHRFFIRNKKGQIVLEEVDETDSPF